MNRKFKEFALNILFGIAVATQAAGQGTKLSAVSQECPVRFGEFPQVTSWSSLNRVRLVGNGLDAVQVLSPGSEGFYVLRVEDKGLEALYGSHAVRKAPETKRFVFFRRHLS